MNSWNYILVQVVSYTERKLYPDSSISIAENGDISIVLSEKDGTRLNDLLLVASSADNNSVSVTGDFFYFSAFTSVKRFSGKKLN